MALNVIFAVYGGLRDGDENKTEAAIVTDALQRRINESPDGNGVVTINNDNMEVDPARGVRKHFAAIVEDNGFTPPKLRAFACEERQTVDFS